MADEPERPRSQYPPPDDPNRGYYPQAPRDGNSRDDKNTYPAPEDPNRATHYQQGSPATGPPRDDRMPYPSADPSRQPQYPYDPRAGQYQPPQHQWNGQYPPPQYPDPTHPGYQYPPPARADGQHYAPPPDAYRLPPPFPGPGYPYPSPHHYTAPQAPAPRQRTAIACKYCRKRKIRCSGYEGSPEGRCQNCVRFNQQCLFHPVSSQGAFVPASAVYGPQAGTPRGADPQGDYRPPQRGYSRDGEPPMLYGAHGQPLGPVNPRDGPPASYPAPQAGYPPQPYPNGSAPPQHQGNGPAYDYRGQASTHPEQIVGRKRSPPDDDPHNETAHSSQSPHPSSRPRTHDSRNNSGGNGYDYPDPTNIAPISPATSTMSYQSHPPAGYYTNGNGNGNQAQARNASPQSAHSYDSPRVLPIRNDGKTPPPAQPSSAGSGRSGMSVRDMLGGAAPKSAGLEPRDRNDNEMLSKLDGKKKQAV